ncbi:UDP-N-acetylmuramate dehydrogenase [Aerococcus sp. UMB8608]|uniref:UDP-N-acetylenolpyruvoylglucosamine reductase n=2 Tax=Aerococcaceae TaxID=186827 RepID=A0A5N1GMA4_9LACT|nr:MULTISPECIES: UDP-N-acetylmuramate dehydrogenase [Aerococcus]KAA9302097.1 UDP-N-acetylmuramate dehydrogenase [Aerococcus sanguinicola]MDK6368474.1 UDP-N-acetylmuramate dehydrogenase [Aerococcus sp. UMB9870]MDK6679557.1 UDP-N-acetylmuramate dehydrogenase [Aerococcus sp. UMB8608]MDK6686401.1 UDP-N-acetylmuramate dehydrogenase [Aerococcus sp. UMB8623]MDK6940977.1 UDP-N-acetylmuramate dehydrogenase [Aerococcus sp. UMB8487]
MKEKFLEHFPQAKVKFDEALSSYSYTRTGGPADILVFPQTIEEVQAIVSYASTEELPFMVLGNSSNLIVRDGGIEGIVMILTDLTEAQVQDQALTVEAGARLIDVSRLAADYSLGGLEFACGIPGSLGGAVFMNAGAYGGEMADIVSQVDYVDRRGNLCELTAEELDFAYRHSCFQENGGIVVRVHMQLHSADQTMIESRMAELTQLRESKQPLDLPSCGSVFKRPEGHYTGQLIQEAGLQGYTVGGAQVSLKHAGFIVNIGQASASDYLAVIAHVQAVVKERYGVDLETEVRIIGRDNQ